jgi:inositol transport system permease protein
MFFPHRHKDHPMNNTTSTAITDRESFTERTGFVQVVTFAEKFSKILFLISLIILFASQSERFFSIRNCLNILTDVSIYGVLSIGMTFVILTAGIDLSIGAVLAFCAMCGAYLIKGTGPERYAVSHHASFMGYSWLISLGTCLVVGVLAWSVHGIAITRIKVPPFVVTLGGMTIWRGATLIVGGGQPISGFDPAYRWWGNGSILWIPTPVWLFFFVAVAGYILLSLTRFGRQVYAVGGNLEAARLAGLPVNKIIVAVYAIMGALAGLAGFMLSARLSSAEAVAGQGYELTVIAAVVIGGTSLFGGLGGVVGTVVGTMLIGVLLNGLVILNVNSYYQQVIIGFIIIIAVGFDTYAKSFRGGS